MTPDRSVFHRNLIQFLQDYPPDFQRKFPETRFAAAQIVSHIFSIGEKFMAPRKTNNRQSNWGDITFATIRLTEENKLEFETWVSSLGDGHQQEIDQFVMDGWKTSTKWDDNNDCFIVSATNENDKDRNYKICVSSRSDISIEAALLNIYKVQIMYRGVKVPTEAAKQNWG